MRNKWYSDNRDLIKWSTLLLITKEYQAERIFQIAYFRHSEYGKVTIGGRELEIPPEVLAHFRDIRNIAKLVTQPEIIVFDDEFGDRDKYFASIKKFIITHDKRKRSIVFIDPDTGLEPFGRPNHNHVLKRELKEIWEVIPVQWILAFYQHKTNRTRDAWIEPKRKQFSEAINISLNDVKVAHGFDMAKDVVFFFAVKTAEKMAGNARPTN